MIARHLGKRSPTEYQIGDDVLVRLPSAMKPRRGGKRSYRLLTCFDGEVIECDVASQRYRVSFNDGSVVQEKWFSVTDLTSPTIEIEQRRNAEKRRLLTGCQRHGE